MPLYEIKGFRKETMWETVYFEIEADSEEDALELVKGNPYDYETDSKEIDGSYDADYEDEDEWEIINVTTT